MKGKLRYLWWKMNDRLSKMTIWYYCLNICDTLCLALSMCTMQTSIISTYITEIVRKPFNVKPLHLTACIWENGEDLWSKCVRISCCWCCEEASRIETSGLKKLARQVCFPVIVDHLILIFTTRIMVEACIAPLPLKTPNISVTDPAKIAEGTCHVLVTANGYFPAHVLAYLQAVCGPLKIVVATQHQFCR